MGKSCIILLLLLAVFINACAPQQSPTPGVLFTVVPSPLPNINPGRATPTNAQLKISQIQPSNTLSPSASDTPSPSPTTEIVTTQTFSPTLTPIPTLKEGQAVPLVNIYMMDKTSGWGIEENGHIVHTVDSATTWKDVTPPQGAYNKNGFYALDSQTAWASPYCLGYLFGGNNLYFCDEDLKQTYTWVTHDGGETWIVSLPICINSGCNDLIASEGDGSLLPESIRFIDAQHGWLVISKGFSMYQNRYNAFSSNDGGKTWDFLFSALTEDIISGKVTALEPLDEKNVFLFTEQSHGAWAHVGNSLWYSQSNDGGKSWNEDVHFAISTNPIGNPAWDNLDCGTIESKAIPTRVMDLTQECHSSNEPARDYFIHLHSEDGGSSWNYWQQTGDVDFINAKSGWQMVAKGDAAHELQHTPDGGLTWTMVKIVEWDGILNFVNDQIGYALAYNQGVMAIMHTTDGGKTWEIKSRAILARVPCLLSTWDVCEP